MPKLSKNEFDLDSEIKSKKVKKKTEIQTQKRRNK